MFKKLFTINYKNKKFLILVDKNHRKTFLEVTSDGKYNYPEYEDYKELNEIYNNYDYTIKYDYNSRLMTYDEKVRYKSTMLACHILLFGTLGLYGKYIIDLEPHEKKSLSITFQQLYKDTSYDRALIDNYYNNEQITRDDVVAVINNNDNLSDYYKQIAIQVLDLNLELDPEINLRIYYENMKDMRIIVQSWEAISKNNTMNIAGYFTPVGRDIYLCQDFAHNDQHVAHEFTHAVHNLIDSSGKDILFIHETRGYSLEEAMTNRIISNLWGYEPTYNIQQKLLSFLIDNVDDFNYHIYNEKGIMGLINELRDKYPNIDIDYIVDYIDTFTTTDYKIGNTQTQPLEDFEFVDELFNIAVNNIDKDDVYLSFETFIKLFDNNIDANMYSKYQNMYLDKLKELKLINDNQFEMIKSFNSICFFDGKLYFGDNVNNSYYDYDNGCFIQIGLDKHAIFLDLSAKIRETIANDILLNEKMNSEVYLQNIIVQCDSFGKIFDGLEIDTKKAIMDAVFEVYTINIEQDNIFGDDYYNIMNILRMDSELYRLRNDYIKAYDKIIIQKGYITEDVIDKVRTMPGFIIDGNKVIPYVDGNDKIMPFSYIQRTQNAYGNVYTNVSFGKTISYTCVDKNGNNYNTKIKDDAIEIAYLEERGCNKLIEYFINNPSDKLWDSDYLYDAFNSLGLTNKDRGKIFKDSEMTIDSDINDNMNVIIGFDDDSNIAVMLYNGNNLIYGSAEKLNLVAAVIPYKTYLKIGGPHVCDFVCIEDIISSQYVNDIKNLALEYLAPNLNVDFVKSSIYQELSDKEYSFSNAAKIIVNGKEDYLRKIYIYSNYRDELVINIFGKVYEIVHNLNESPYNYFESKDVYFRFLEDCLEYFNVLPDNENVYHLTEEQIVDIVKNYINEEFSVVKNK